MSVIECGHGWNLAQLLLIGGVQLETLARGQEKVVFKAWAVAVELDAAKRGLTLAEGQLDWLWEALLSEPKVRRALRSRVVSRDEEWKDQEPMQVLSASLLLLRVRAPILHRHRQLRECVGPP